MQRNRLEFYEDLLNMFTLFLAVGMLIAVIVYFFTVEIGN